MRINCLQLALIFIYLALSCNSSINSNTSDISVTNYNNNDNNNSGNTSNITTITYANLFINILRSGSCPNHLAQTYCLNNGECFMVKVAQRPIYSCECANGFTGERCESKEFPVNEPSTNSPE